MRPTLPLMLFAAGFGTRMGALTKDRPKPLIKVANKALLDHARDTAADAGITQIAVNTHYHGQQIIDHLQGSHVIISREDDQILDTGGGLKAALPLFTASGPVLTLNTDAVWTGENPLSQLLAAWDPDRMDQLFLLLPAAKARSQTGRSDFVMDNQGRIDWAQGRDGYLYLGAQIINPALLTEEQPVFSLHAPWSRAIANGRAFGIVHKGDWCDVGHPDGIIESEQMLAAALHV